MSWGLGLSDFGQRPSMRTTDDIIAEALSPNPSSPKP
jgi:hypothetical protein